ncbi:MAG: hypothetical protein AAF621_03890 [Pseudomonadota bacterium]
MDKTIHGGYNMTTIGTNLIKYAGKAASAMCGIIRLAKKTAKIASRAKPYIKKAASKALDFGRSLKQAIAPFAVMMGNIIKTAFGKAKEKFNTLFGMGRQGNDWVPLTTPGYNDDNKNNDW